MLSLGHSYTVCITFLQPHWRNAYLDCQQTANVSPAATHIVQLCSSITVLGNVFFFNAIFSELFFFCLFYSLFIGVSASRQTLMCRQNESSPNSPFPRFVFLFFLFLFVFAKPITRPVCKEGIQGFISL